LSEETDIVTASNRSPQDARVIAMRPSSRDGLGALAAAWQASQGPTVRPFARVAAAPPADAPRAGRVAAEPPYWPDGPSAA
jgi:hypothetical protein